MAMATTTTRTTDQNKTKIFFFKSRSVGQLDAKSVGQSASRSVNRSLIEKKFSKQFFLQFFFLNLCWLVNGNNNNGDDDDNDDNDDNDDDDDTKDSDIDWNEIKLSYEKQIHSNRVRNMMRPVGIRRYIKFLMDIL